MARILVIDDNQAELHHLTILLEKHGHQVIAAENGADGIVLCIDEQPDVVLMDNIMSEINGFQATRQLANNNKTQHIPIIIISDPLQDADKVWGQRQGAKGFLFKPITEKNLITSLDNILETMLI